MGKTSILQWMAPELVRGGLVQNEDWVEAHCTRACAVFPNEGMHIAATLLAALHPRSIDYIEQAPVLVAGARWTCELRRQRERLHVANIFGPMVDKGMRLRDVMARYKLPMVLRKLRGIAIMPGTVGTIVEWLPRIDPSTLSQIIPVKPGDQRTWITHLRDFKQAFSRHHFRNVEQEYALFVWGATALSRWLLDTKQGGDLHHIGEVIDFLVQPDSGFTDRWSWARACELSTAWHQRLRDARDAAGYGFPASLEVDYSPWPNVPTIVEDLEFVPLRTYRALADEGEAMRHCVRTYAQHVATRHSQIYSIRTADRRVATVQFVRGNPVQIKGPCNAKVTTQVAQAAHLFARLASTVMLKDLADLPHGQARQRIAGRSVNLIIKDELGGLA